MAIQPGPGSTDVSVPDALPVLPLRDAVVFPLTVVPLAVDEPRSIRLIDDVMRGNRLLALVVEGHRRLPAHDEAVYHVAGIRQGQFRLEVPLPAPVDSDRVDASYERGVLRITLPKRI